MNFKNTGPVSRDLRLVLPTEKDSAYFGEKTYFFLERLIFAWLASSANTNATSVFISSMAMIFIFGFANFYLLEIKLEHLQKSDAIDPKNTMAVSIPRHG